MTRLFKMEFTAVVQADSPKEVAEALGALEDSAEWDHSSATIYAETDTGGEWRRLSPAEDEEFDSVWLSGSAKLRA